MLENTNIDIGIARYVYNNSARLDKLKKEVSLYLKYNRNDCNYNYMLGHIYYIEENYEAAEKCFKKCILLNEKNMKYHIALAFVYRHLGMYERSDDIIFNKNHDL